MHDTSQHRINRSHDKGSTVGGTEQDECEDVCGEHGYKMRSRNELWNLLLLWP